MYHEFKIRNLKLPLKIAHLEDIFPQIKMPSLLDGLDLPMTISEVWFSNLQAWMCLWTCLKMHIIVWGILFR